MLSSTPTTLSPTKRPNSRLSHLLMGGESRTTPSRQTPTAANTPESPKLMNALINAARGGVAEDQSEDEYSPMPMSPSLSSMKRSSSSEHSFVSSPSYSNSIEAMAAEVEAVVAARKSPSKSPRKSSHCSIRKPHCKQLRIQQTRKQLFSNSKKVVSKKTIGQLIGIVIVIPILLIETFLSVLVFAYNRSAIYKSIGGEGLASEKNSYAAEIDVKVDDDVFHQQQKIVVGESDVGEIFGGGGGDGFNSPIESMRSMLNDAWAQFNDGFDKNGKESVETICLAVWNRAVEALSLPTNQDDEDNNTVKALAMDAQRCLGGVGLAFLSRDVDFESVMKSRDVFESLSLVDPYNVDVRAGLGTSLLILGITQDDESMLKLAMFHLKVASTLCQGNAAVVRSQAIFQNDTSSPISAAIFHNLALANISLGNDSSSVSLLLRAAAIRRDYSVNQTTNLFWNAPADVLLAMEQQAMLMGAKKSSTPQKKKSRFPFLSDRFASAELTFERTLKM